MLTFTESDVQIDRIDNIYFFSGILLLQSYNNFENYFFDSFKDSQEQKPILFDFTSLEYISAAGLQSLIRVITMCPMKRIKVHMNNKINWQKKTIPILQLLKPEGLEFLPYN